ncbi:MAG: hypothetical protein L3J69_03915 [Desulfobacula sp.]|nr:hypothetical protein [Desulfobacula sp.]
MDLKFAEQSEAIVIQLGFKDLKSFVKNQALIMLMAKIEKFEMESKLFETKYNMPFKKFQIKITKLQNKEVFSEEDDYLDWRFATESMDRLKKQKLELEYA